MQIQREQKASLRGYPIPAGPQKGNEINRPYNLIGALSSGYEADLVLMDIEANKGGYTVC